MQTHSETIRFEVLVNDEPRCVAGIDGFGVMSIVIDWVLRDPDEKPKGIGKEKWSKQKLRYSVGGIRAVDESHVNWRFGKLRPGDEVTVRVLGPGDFDKPRHKSQ